MSEFKVGDKVVLRPKTKPYTFINFDGKIIKKGDIVCDDKIYIVVSIEYDGDVTLRSKNNDMRISSISPHHLKHAEPITKVKGEFNNFQPRDLQELEIPSNDIDTTELRLAIFNGNPSRTLEEMQDIEKWLLNK